MGRPSYEEVCSKFYYDSYSGKLFWRNGRRKLKEAGSKDKGDIRIRFGSSRQRFYAHQLIWFMFYKEWPDSMIDHIDRNRSNNRIENLRLAPNSENQFNRPSKNIYFCKQTNKWRVLIWKMGQRFCFGRHICLGKAFNTAQEARCKMQGEFNYR